MFSSCMWPIISCGSPSSDTRSTQCCRRTFRFSPELEEQSLDPEQKFCGRWWTSKSIFSAFLQQFDSLHPSPQQPGSVCSISRSSMLSETELTLGGGFSNTFLIRPRIRSSCCVTRCSRSVTEAGTGFSGCWIWHQHNIALWRQTQRGNSVTYNGTEWLWAGQKRGFNNGQYKRNSWCFCATSLNIPKYTEGEPSSLIYQQDRGTHSA